MFMWQLHSISCLLTMSILFCATYCTLSTMVAAMIDRLTYRSFVLNMNSNKPYRAEFAAQSDSTQTD